MSCRPPRTPAHRVRRAELAATAYAQVAERGLEGLRVREVAAEAGINHATLIYYFPTKANLVAGVVDHVLGLLVAPAVTPAPQPDQAVMHRLAHDLEDIAARLERQPQIFRVLTELQLRGARDAEVGRALARMDDAWTRFLVGMLRSGIDSGELRSDLDADRAAGLLRAVFRGIGLAALRRDDQKPRDLVDEASKMLASWLAARSDR